MDGRHHSQRLLQNGYYTAEGRRTISYYEAPNRKMQRRPQTETGEFFSRVTAPCVDTLKALTTWGHTVLTSVPKLSGDTPPSGVPGRSGDKALSGVPSLSGDTPIPVPSLSRDKALSGVPRLSRDKALSGVPRLSRDKPRIQITGPSLSGDKALSGVPSLSGDKALSGVPVPSLSRDTDTLLSGVPQVPGRRGWLRTLFLICAAVLISLFTMNSLMMTTVGQMQETRPSPQVSPSDGVALWSHTSPTTWPWIFLQALGVEPKDTIPPSKPEENAKPDAGHCLTVQGLRAHIELPKATLITDITLGHNTKTQTPGGAETSVPRHVSLHAREELDGPETFLGQFEYKKDGPDMQTFAVTNASQGAFKRLRINVESTWGHLDDTCMYHIELQGTPAPTASA